MSVENYSATLDQPALTFLMKLFLFLGIWLVLLPHCSLFLVRCSPGCQWKGWEGKGGGATHLGANEKSGLRS